MSSFGLSDTAQKFLLKKSSLISPLADFGNRQTPPNLSKLSQHQQLQQKLHRSQPTSPTFPNTAAAFTDAAPSPFDTRSIISDPSPSATAMQQNSENRDPNNLSARHRSLSLMSSAPSNGDHTKRKTRTYYEEYKTSFPRFQGGEDSAAPNSRNRDSFDGQSVSLQYHDITGDNSGGDDSDYLTTADLIYRDYNESIIMQKETLRRRKIVEDSLVELDGQLDELTARRRALNSELNELLESQLLMEEHLDALVTKIEGIDDEDEDYWGPIPGDDRLAGVPEAPLPLDVDSATCFKTLTGHSAPVSSLDIFQSHDVLVSGDAEGQVRVWDLGTFRTEFSFKAHSGPISCVRYNGDLAITSSSSDKRVNLWRIGSIQDRTFAPPSRQDPRSLLATSFQAHLVGGVNTLQFDSQMLITGGQDGKVKIWDMHTFDCLNTLHAMGEEHDILLHRSESSSNSLVGLAPLAHTTPNSIRGVSALQFYQHALATGGQDGIVRLWDTRVKSSSSDPHAACKRTLSGHSQPITSLAFDDTHLITGSLDRSIRVWDLRIGAVVEGFVSNSINGIADLAFTPETIITAAGDSSLMLFDRASHRQSLLHGHTEPVNCLRYLDRQLLTGSGDHTIKIWSL